MALSVIWSVGGKRELYKHFEYYKDNVSLEFAQEFVSNVLILVNRLAEHPFMGQKELLLEDFPQGFRYLVYKKYKIIYFVDLSKKEVKISDVFHCSQDPSKIRKLK